MLTFCAPPADGSRLPTSATVDKASVVAAPARVAPIAPAALVASACEPAPGEQLLSAGEARDRWTEVVSALAHAALISAMVRELAMHAECVRIDPSTSPAEWVVQVERETLRSPANIEKLQLALGAHLGAAVSLKAQAGAVSDTPAVRAQAEAARRQAVAERVIHDDPLVRTLLSQYAGARIVSGSIKVQ
jgi:DNA polymerase-3 subunit gamma/tau